MSEETGKAITVHQRQRVNDLHLRRGEEVRMAREIRESVGRGTGAYDEAWGKVDELTGQIEIAEAELKALERDNPVRKLLEAQ
jgi:hypothetical protein